MSKFNVLWTRTAEQDLENIIEYIARDSVDNALKALQALRSKASNLATLPDRGRVVPEMKAYGISTYRELAVSPWRIIYRTESKSVIVLAVIDARRNLEDILLDRLLYTAK
jgi:addiction module RelE/StbE family toxin